MGVAIIFPPLIHPQQAWREYVRVKEEGLKNLQALKKKLQSSIDKTEPFVVVWRRARNVSYIKVIIVIALKMILC